jgi:Tol biopolymer transport system component
MARIRGTCILGIVLFAGILPFCACSSNSLDPNDAIAVGADPNEARPVPIPADEEIVFYSDRDGDIEVYTMRSDGSDVTQLTFNDAIDIDPTWSPDGSKIAFMSTRDGGEWEIYVMDADGSNPTRLTNNRDLDSRPAWSPDGTQIAFSGQRMTSVPGEPFPHWNWDVYVIQADGSGETRLTTHPAVDAGPSWSDAGIVFESDRTGAYQIYAMQPDGSDQRAIAQPRGVNIHPVWHYDGAQVVYVSGRMGNDDLYVTRDSRYANVTHHPSTDHDATWSSDGSFLSFWSDRDGDPEIFVMSAGGSRPKQLTQSPGLDAGSDWRPSGGLVSR